MVKPTGNIFIQCDDRDEVPPRHWLMEMIAIIAGQTAFRNHITWERSSTGNDANTKFRRNADYILYYAKPEAEFRPIHDPYRKEYIERSYRHDDGDGRGLYRLDNLAKPKGSPGYFYEWRGYSHPPNGWRCPESTMQEHHDNGLLHYPVDRHGNPHHERRIAFKRFPRHREGREARNRLDDAHQRPGPRVSDVEARGPDRRPDPRGHGARRYGLRSVLRMRLDVHRGGPPAEGMAGMRHFPRGVQDARGPHGRDGNPSQARRERGEARGRSESESPKWRQGIRGAVQEGPSPRIRGGLPRLLEGEGLPDDLTLDHNLPKSRGGGNEFSNIQLACGSCNSRKQDKGTGEYYEHLAKTDLPRYNEIIGRRAVFFASGKS